MLVGFWNIKHDIQHNILNNSLEGAGTGFPLNSLLGYGMEGIISEFQIHIVHFHQLFVLSYWSIARLGENPQQGVFVQILQGADNRETANDFWNNTKFHQILWSGFVNQIIVFGLFILAFDFGTKANPGISSFQPLGNDFLNAYKGTAYNKENILGIYLDSRSLWMFSLASGGKFHLAAFQHFQQGLLYTLMAWICGNSVVLAGFAGDFVELVQIDNTVLTAGNILVGCIVQIADSYLYIRADKASLGKTGGISYSKRNVQHFGQMG